MRLGRGGRLPGKSVFPGAGCRGLDVEEVIRQLRCLSEEDRGRERGCMRTFAVPSDGEVSSLSNENSGGAATHVALSIDESAKTPCG